jgi:cellulose synthase/poly-beta-1,6-N-acetylglucosamine synthase-like glycosyltransferase
MSVAVLIFFAVLAFILYVLIGYPLLLSVYARWFPKPIRKQLEAVRISILIPVRNGERWIEGKLRSLLQSDYPGNLLEVVVVSDGSSDRTEAIVREFGDPRVRLLPLPAGGKAIAVTQALKVVTGEIIVLTDVRQLFESTAISKLVSCFADASVGVVTGELVIREGERLEEYNTGLYWKYEKWIRRNLNRIDAMLGATGAIYAIRACLRQEIPADILLDDVYLPFAAAFKGYRIFFEDDAKAYDFPTSLQSEFRRKVRTQAGIYQIVARFPQLLWPGNRRFIHFLSHKMGRLLLPFAMLATLVSTFFLPQPLLILAAAGQACFYGAALVDPFVPERSSLKRLTGVIRAFLVLVAAALCATAVFFLPAQNLWKETRVSVAAPATRVEESGRS